MAISSKQIMNKIGCKYLRLCKGDGYWYFVYDDLERNIFETCSIPVMFLSQMKLDLWVEDGLAFVKQVKAED